MKALLVALPAALLTGTGCVNMSGLDGGSKYACAAPDGVACDSVSGTYANALQQNLPSQRAVAPVGAPTRGRAAPAALPAATTPAVPLPRLAPPDASPALRSPARILRLWTKPWEDADGDLWDQGFVYVQVEGGRWQLDHVQQRIRDRYTPLRPPPNATVGAAPSAPVEAAMPSTADETGSQRPVAAPLPGFPALTRQPSTPFNRP